MLSFFHVKRYRPITDEHWNNDLIVHTISYDLSYVHFISIVQSPNLKYSLTYTHQPFAAAAVLTEISVQNKKIVYTI